jgi:hypothetical protein
MRAARVPALFAMTLNTYSKTLAAQRERQPPARVWEDPVADPNACEQDRPVFRARSAGRLDAVLGRAAD